MVTYMVQIESTLATSPKLQICILFVLSPHSTNEFVSFPKIIVLLPSQLHYKYVGVYFVCGIHRNRFKTVRLRSHLSSFVLSL